MCGIVGATAQRNIAQILLEGLKRLEYRGYDSAGIAIIDPTDHTVHRCRVLGKVAALETALQEQPLTGHLGIAHTRWATHGQPTEENAHPHTSQNEIAVVHNGIIENHEALRQQLIDAGYQFASQTDTEVIAHLAHFHYQQSKDMLSAVQKTTAALEGAFALGLINKDMPDTLYAIRKGSPLVVGIGIGEHFIASDPLALLPVTQRFIYLEEGDLAVLDCKTHTIYDASGKPVTRNIIESDANADVASKGKYRHFMEKEIFEQPSALLDTINGHIINDHVSPDTFGHNARDIFSQVKRVQIVACGTSYHAARVARHWLESLAGIPCQVEIASENRYRKGVVEPGSLFIALSQSGETADTLAALRQAKKRGHIATLAICNAAESSLARESDLLFFMHAGVEVGVAATKTFTSQLIALLLLTLVLGNERALDATQIREITHAIQSIPNLISETLKQDAQIKTISKRFKHKNHALFLGRGEMYPVAMEGALKLKEISYLHAESYPAGELKHGPLALVDKDMPLIVVAPNNALSDKLESNIQEIIAREGEMILFADKDFHAPKSDYVTTITMPPMPEIIAPIIYTVPLQLLAYHIALLKGTDVDQPRNLAKSVTVE